MRAIIIHNAEAGDTYFDKSELIATTERAGFDVVYRSIKDKDWDDVLAEPADFVVAAGGDGTIRKVAKHLIGKGIPLAPLPLGTANNISRTLGLTELSYVELVECWHKNRRIKFDVGIAKGPFGEHHFLESFGIGVVARLITRVENIDDIGRDLGNTREELDLAIKKLRDLLREADPQELEVSVDGQDCSGEYLMFEVMNVAHVGPRLQLAKTARPDDGLFDIVFVTPEEREKLDRYLESLLLNDTATASFPIRRTVEVRIKWQGFAVRIDDEIWPDSGSNFPLEPADIELGIDKGALEFLVP